MNLDFVLRRNRRLRRADFQLRTFTGSSISYVKPMFLGGAAASASGGAAASASGGAVISLAC